MAQRWGSAERAGMANILALKFSRVFLLCCFAASIAAAFVAVTSRGDAAFVLVGDVSAGNVQTFEVQAPTAADAAAQAAHLWAGAQIGHALPFIQQNTDLPDRHEAYYTVHANNQKEAAQIAVEEYRETHPSSIMLGRSGNTFLLNAKNQKEAAAKAVAMVAAERPGCAPPQVCNHPKILPTTSVNPVQINARLVFPPADQKLAKEEPCVPTGDPRQPCQAEEHNDQDIYTQEDINARMMRMRKHAEERLQEAQQEWHGMLKRVRARYLHRMEEVRARIRALNVKIRRLESGPGAVMDLSNYLRLRQRLQSMENSLARLDADQDLVSRKVNQVVTTPGAPGETGPRGTQGVTGLPGRMGLVGKAGKGGYNGVPGKHGDPGVPGPPGITGPRGLSGKNGAPGKEGAPGPPGLPGADGMPGPKGLVGSVGNPGKNGMNGAAGRPGPPGPPGQSGYNGIDGPPGARGLPGNTGLAGNRGKIGAGGAVGLEGPPGKPGRVGPPGLAGKPGVPGAPGLAGKPGRPGPMGDAGEAGMNGAEGARGVAVMLPPVENLVSGVPLVNTAYTPEQYAAYLNQAVAAAQAAGCACAAGASGGHVTVVTRVVHSCPCLQQKLHQIVNSKDKGSVIKAALRRVMRAAEEGGRGRTRGT